MRGMGLNKKQRTFEEFSDITFFSILVERGSHNDMEEIKEFLLSYPKRFMLDPSDSNHILNRKNVFGESPLYLACKNGSIEMIKFLLEKGANYSKSWRNYEEFHNSIKNHKESPLQVAVRWGHVSTIHYILSNINPLEEIDIKESIKISSIVKISQMLKEYAGMKGIVLKSKWKSLFCNFSK